MIKFLAILNLVQLVLILGSVIFFFIYREIIKGKINKLKEEKETLMKKIVEYHDFAKTLYANLHLLKYYEKVDLETQKKIDTIAENINTYVPIVNEFHRWLKEREATEHNIPNKEKK